VAKKVTWYHDVIIVGGGLAGLRAAVGLCDRHDVAVVSKVHPIRSHSIAAQGGINAALANNPAGRDDTWEKHAFDTIKGSDYLADQDAVELMCREAIGVVYEMEHWGCPFSRFPDGTIAQRPFGGAGFPRTCYSADLTGHVLLNTLYERAVARKVRIYYEHVALGLAVEGGVCHGVVLLDQATGALLPVAAKAILFATGGYGRVYYHSTNALINNGSGIGMAYDAGIPLKDMEFVQFHPTSLLGTTILISEACRGEGGYLVNRLGERFMERYAPKAMELAPRDIVSRSIQTEIEEDRGFESELGRYVHLDLRHLGREKILARLPGIRRICIDFAGIDPVERPIPIMPCQHYSMGGIATTSLGETALAGFFAAGECACVSVHGANRLGGNSLLDTIVFGKVCAASIDAYLTACPPTSAKTVERAAAGVERKVAALSEGRGERPAKLAEDLRRTMDASVGIFRTKAELESALRRIEEIAERYAGVRVSSAARHMNYELIGALELESMIHVALATTLGALLREESRGAHFRRDFPARNDAEWLKHSLVTKNEATGGPSVAYRPPAVTKYQPMERTY
jgi:succinate dehydrogenase / fumarate reductase flavoprotein subunit